MNRQTCNQPELRPAPASAAPLGGLRGGAPTDAAAAGFFAVSRPPRAVGYERILRRMAALVLLAILVVSVIFVWSAGR